MDWQAWNPNKMSGMEFIWLVIALGTAGYGLYETFTQGLGHSYPLFIITAIAAMMHYIRKQMRKQEELRK